MEIMSNFTASVLYVACMAAYFFPKVYTLKSVLRFFFMATLMFDPLSLPFKDIGSEWQCVLGLNYV